MCIENRKGGGTSIYIHKDIQYKNRNDISLPKKHYESIFIEVDKALFSTNRNTIIGEIYKPPTSNLKTFNIELEKLLVKIKKERKYAFIMGDFNTKIIIQNRFKILSICFHLITITN